jgi:N-acetylglucosamine kinase-like BadF-type ATPase
VPLTDYFNLILNYGGLVMILIADSGSTKTTWCLLNSTTGDHTLVQTAGINPYYQDEAAILNTLEKEYDTPLRNFKSLHFYGAGCANPEASSIVEKALTQFFNTPQIEVASDLMGAAHALCGHDEGIACILGTGSNSCHYSGHSIVHNVSPLGFILGDEGSGAALGKKLLSDVLKNQLPEALTHTFFDTYALTPAEVLDNIYRKPFPNRFAAQFTQFISEHIKEPVITKIVTEAFAEFFSRNVMQYPSVTSLPVHFTGSIAFHFKEQLIDVAKSFSLKVGNISKDPMPGLIQYYSK